MMELIKPKIDLFQDTASGKLIEPETHKQYQQASPGKDLVRKSIPTRNVYESLEIDDDDEDDKQREKKQKQSSSPQAPKSLKKKEEKGKEKRSKSSSPQTLKKVKKVKKKGNSTVTTKTPSPSSGKRAGARNLAAARLQDEEKNKKATVANKNANASNI
jgi:hypothetical protein